MIDFTLRDQDQNTTFLNCLKRDDVIEEDAIKSLIREAITNDQQLKLIGSSTIKNSSRIGVQALLDRDLNEASSRWIGVLCEPYMKNVKTCPYIALSEIPRSLKYLHALEVADIEIRLQEHASLRTKSLGEIANFLTCSEFEIRYLATELAQEWGESPANKLSASEALLGKKIIGDTAESRYARTCDPKFWRRSLNVSVARAREHFFMRMSLVSSRSERYVSDFSLDVREAQLIRQAEWMKNTLVVPAGEAAKTNHIEKKKKSLCLADIADGPAERFAKLYTFIHAIDQLGIEAKLLSAMLTLTLEPEWHPNPKHGINQWNGFSPRDAHKSFCKRWQSISRDLHRLGIRLTGFRVAEPHQDGCPHYHVWMLYKGEDEMKILSTVMKYFPAKLKIRTPNRKGEKKQHCDEIYEDRVALINDQPRTVNHPKEGAQVELSRIDRAISTGASYVLKYVMKSINVDDKLKEQIRGETNNDFELNNNPTAKRVDAYRSLWGIHQGQLFGVAKCLTIWDEFRRLTVRPKNQLLRKLWAQARGGSKGGRIEAGTGQRGDAQSFLKTLGGLDAARNASSGHTERLVLARLVEEEENRYGDQIRKTKGILLLRKKRVLVEVDRTNKKTKVPRKVMVWRIKTEIITSIRTKILEWKFQKKEVFSKFNIISAANINKQFERVIDLTMCVPELLI